MAAPFDAPTRRAAAAHAHVRYIDQINETADDFRNAKTWTPSTIRAASLTAGHHFFDRETMRFWGDTLASFRVICELGEITLERTRDGKRWTFHPATAELRPTL